MVSFTILCSADVIVFVKDNVLQGRMPDKNIPALSALVDKSEILARYSWGGVLKIPSR
jgi:hypothetical protein